MNEAMKMKKNVTMMTKAYHAMRLWVMVFAFMTCSMVSAADYLVYSVVGTAKIFEGSKTVSLNARKTLSASSKLVIGKESAVTVLDEVNSKMYSFTTEGTHTVGSLLKAAKTPKNLSKQYLSYMVKQLFSKESKNLSHPSTYMQVTATSYRATARDSFLLNRLASMAEMTASVESSLIQPKNLLSTDMDVRFELVSCETGEAIDPEVDVFTNCYVRVTNNTTEPLYVNVLDIDDRGNKYLVLPVDEAATCAHLLVPAQSTVAFKSEPFEFSEPKSRETFLLVATEEPVDFSILMSPIRGNGGDQMKSGIYRISYHTK
jgi:hypothetical protein